MMTDKEWAAFRSDHLSRHNVYIRDEERHLYDAPQTPSDGPGGALGAQAGHASPEPLADQAEAHSPSGVAITKPQEAVEATKIIKRERK